MARHLRLGGRGDKKLINLRKHLRLEKSKNKAEQTASFHAVDGVALACYQFLQTTGLTLAYFTMNLYKS